LRGEEEGVGEREGRGGRRNERYDRKVVGKRYELVNS